MTITERADGKGWLFDAGVVDGKRVRITRKTKQAAREVMREFQEKRQLHGDKIALASPAEMSSLFAARERLAEVGATIEQAVEFYLAHSRPSAGSITVAEALKLWQRSRGDKRSGKHAKNVRLAVELLVEDLELEERMVSAVTAGEIQRWIRRPDWSGATQESYRRNLSAVFGWALKEGYLTANPCAAVVCEESSADEEIEFLTVGQCAALLENVRRNDLELIPYVCLGLFAGIRPAELGRMTGSAIDLERAEVVVSSKNTARKRGRFRRVVDLSENCVEWLRLVTIDPEEPVCPENHRKRWDTVKAVVSPWPYDGLRHTFATMHYAHHRSEAALQVLMGHYSAEMLHRHYRGMVRKGDAEEFWNLRPTRG